MMKTAIIIQIEQLGQYGTKSANTHYFLLLADFDPANIVFRNLSRFYIHIEDKTETPCDVTNCRLIRQNVKKTTENKQY